MSNFWMRALTGAVLVIVLVGSIILSFESFAILFFVITLFGLWEFYGLAVKDEAQPQRIYGTLAGGLLFAMVAHDSWQGINDPGFMGAPWYIAIIPFIFLPFFIELYRKKEKPFTNIAYTLLGIIYIALPFSLLLLISIDIEDGTLYRTYNFHYILGFFILMWTSDTGAYICGKTFGKHKLYERISPKKTWEGTVGGGGLCLIAAWLLSRFFTELPLHDWLAIATIIAIAGNLGDLAESLFKRSINIKDSGNILPGHGGILDRFDAAIIAAPFVFTYLTMAKHWF